MSTRRLLLFVILMVACGGITLFVYTYGTTLINEEAIEETGNEYMTAIQVGDFNTAFTIIDPTFQSQMANPAGLQNLLESWGFFPADWNFYKRGVESGVGALEASVKMTDGRRMGVALTLVQIEGDWRVTRMEFLTS